MSDNKNISEEDLKEGGELFEMFWLRPSRHAGKRVAIRLRINKKWGGWKVKDEIITSIGLEVGDTISTEITPYFTTGIIDDDNDTDLFASDKGADWLLDNKVTIGTIIDCVVRFAYAPAAVGPNGKVINKISLIFEEGISVVGTEENDVSHLADNSFDLDSFLKNLW